MLNRSFYWLMGVLVFATAGLLTTSCNREFDAPPSFIEPNITANVTIKDLKTRHTMGQIEQITEDLTVGGVVVADDKSGNFYKSIAIQDATGGITVRLDGSNLYTSYPVGRKVYIKLKGLYLGDYNKLYQIGGGIDDTDPARPELAPLASSLFDTYIVKGSTGNTVTPKVVRVDQLHDSLQSMLIQINNMEFVPADTSKTYADAAGKATRNLNVKACAGNSLILRTSGYSTFAGVNVPNGNGTLLSVYTVFGTTKQLVIRDTSDVRFTGPRCGAGPTTEMNIADVRALYTGTNTFVPDGKRISGIVISDRAANNQDDNNLILQQGDGKSGIMIRFAEPHAFDLGDKIEVNISNQSLEEYVGVPGSTNKGILQLNGVPNDFAKEIGTGTITPRETTATEIAANFEAWESTLVKIKNVTVTEGTAGKWGGTTTLTDATGSVKGFTRTAATFSGTAYPTTNVPSITGYLTRFDGTKQLILRTIADVEIPVTPPPPAGADFEAVYDFAAVTATSGTTDPTPVPTVPGLTMGAFQAVGVSINPNTTVRFSFTNWSTGATTGLDVFTGALDATKYYEVTITPQAGKQLDLTSLTFKLQRSGTGVRQAAVRASVDNYAANLPASINPANPDLSVVPTNIFQVSDATSSAEDGCTITFGTGFINMTSPITLRFYGFNAEGTGGTFSIDDVKLVGKVH